MCELTQILGVDRDGAFAGYVAVPESVIWQNDRAKLPPEIATLQEPFGNAVFATGEQDLAGRTVAVLGCGPVGLFTVAIASASGAALVLASDRTTVPARPRRRSARTRRRTSSESRRRRVVPRAKRGHGLDVVFEMSGAPRAIATRSGSRATAAASSSSGFRRGRSRSTSPSR